jgi:large subunit ribosomal protein L27
VGIGRDWTIFSLIEGTVLFDKGGRRINVVPLEGGPILASLSQN